MSLKSFLQYQRSNLAANKISHNEFVFPVKLIWGEQGWRSGESARLPPMWPGFDSRSRTPGVICGLSLLLVLVLAPRGFSPGAPVFPSPQKPTHPNSNSILEVSPISISLLDTVDT